MKDLSTWYKILQVCKNICYNFFRCN